MRPARRLWPFVLSLVALAPSCRAQTEITVALSTDVRCADLQGTSVTVGRLGELETKPVTSSSTSCDDSGDLGTLVVVPSGGKADEVAVKIIAGVGRDPATCVPPYGKGCIVARRALRYIPHTGLRLSVPLRAACNGIPCGATETCVGGACVSATITDPASCATSCDETVLAAGPIAPTDAGGADGGDGAAPDAATLPDASSSSSCKYTCDFTLTGTPTTSCAAPAVTLRTPLAQSLAATLDMTGYQTVAVTLDMCDEAGFFFHFADSPGCTGVGGDTGQSSNDAELFLFPTAAGQGPPNDITLWEYANQSVGNGLGMQVSGFAPSTGCSTRTITFGDKMFSVPNFVSSSNDGNFLRLNPPTDTEGTPDALWYLGLNRSVGSAAKTGSGITKATLCFN